MRLESLTARNFRGIDSQDVTFGDGITIVSGFNEAGKTSLIEAFDHLIEHKATSNNGKVRSVQPVGKDVGPEVEAVFTVGPHKVRYFKRWLKSKTTELTFLEGPRRGQSETGDAAHNVLTDLWEGMDTTLWKASRLMQATALEVSPLSSSSSLQKALSVQAGEVIDDTASTPVLTRVSEIVDEFYTKGRAEGKLLKDARKRVQEAQNDVTDSTSALEALEADIAALTALEEEINQRTGDLKLEHERLAPLEEQVTVAHAAKATIKESEKTVASAQKDVDSAQAALDARSLLIASAKEAEDELAALKEKRNSAREDAAPLEKEISDLAARAKEEREKHKVVSDLLAQANRFDRSKRAREDIKAMEALLTKYEALTSEIAQVTAGLSPIDPKTVEKVTDLEREIEIAETVAKAGAAQISMVALAGDRHVLLDGEDISLGESPHNIPVLTDVTVEVPGELRFTVSPHATSAEALSRLEAQRDELKYLLADNGAESVKALRSARVFFEEQERKLAALKESRTDLLDGKSADDIRDDLATQKTWVAEQGDAKEGDIDALTAQEKELSGQVSDTEAVLSAKKAEAETARNQLATLEGRVENQRGTHSRAVTALAEARERNSDEELDKTLASASKALDQHIAELNAAKEKLEESGGDALLEDHESTLKHIAGLEQRLDEVRRQYGQDKAVLDSKNTVGIQQKLDASTSEMQRAEQELESLLSRAESAKLLEEVLIRHQQAAHRKYIAPFRHALEELGRATYQNPTFGVDIDEELAVTHRIMDGVLIPFDQLSTGAKEQLSILIKLATAQLVSDEDAVPVMFDDTLGYSDRRRLHRVVSAIENNTSAGQVIIFTANDDRFAGLTNATHIRL